MDEVRKRIDRLVKLQLDTVNLIGLAQPKDAKTVPAFYLLVRFTQLTIDTLIISGNRATPEYLAIIDQLIETFENLINPPPPSRRPGPDDGDFLG